MIEAIKSICPKCIESIIQDGKVIEQVNLGILKSELERLGIAKEESEKYEFNWIGKSKAKKEVDIPTSKYFVECKEESVDFDTTENLYIEGDNLDALKLLRQNYLNKIKMIYIDPPYNTGNDFIYNDKFDSHSDWLTFMYPRLLLARDLLTEDGVIFISIDDNEQANLKLLCDDVFGEENFVGVITWGKKRKGSYLSKSIVSLTEYVVVYSKNKSVCLGLYGGVADENESQPILKRTNNVSILSIPANVVNSKLPDGIYKAGVYGESINPVHLLDNVQITNGIITNKFRIEAPFRWSQQMFDEELAKGATFIINTTNFQIRVYRVHEENKFKGVGSFINGVDIKGTNEDAYEELEQIFKIKKIFDYSKPTNYIKVLIEAASHFDNNSIILDFFSGSATTAHAVMKLNAEDGGKRKFIMVQIPEECAEDSEAYKAGYKNICEIGKERIRRAGQKIKEEYPDSEVDFGFKVLKING